MKHRKIKSFEEIKQERLFARELESCGIKKFFIFTNGCFDLFHAGHASLLNTPMIHLVDFSHFPRKYLKAYGDYKEEELLEKRIYNL